MDKEVKITLPKGKKVELINTSIKDDNIVVKYKLEEPYVPKNGDIVFVKLKSSNWISIFKEYGDTHLLSYCNFSIRFGSLYCKLNEINYLSYIQNIVDIRLSTEEESSKLFSALKETGLAWNPRTKSIEKIRWRAKYGCTYYSIDKFGNVFSLMEQSDASDNINYINGAYFETEEQANIVADKIKEIYKSND